MWYGRMGDYGFGVWLMIIIGILLIGLVIWAVISASRGGGSFPTLGAPKQDPLEIAKMRYAKGEITKEQFEDIKKNLQ